MAAGTLASRITGVFRDIALVAAIGTGIFSDTYSIANSIPNIIYILIAGGAINAVLSLPWLGIWKMMLIKVNNSPTNC